MSQENVELTHRAYDAFNQRDMGAFLALMDRDVQAESRLAARAAITATTESVTGGRICSKRSRTTPSKRSKHASMGT